MGWLTHDELEMIWNETVRTYGSYSQKPRKTKRTLNEDSWSSGRDSEEYLQDSAVLPLDQPIRLHCVDLPDDDPQSGSKQ
jgi:hypothetical protein